VNSTVKTAIFWVAMLIASILLWRVVQTGNTARSKELSYSEFRKEVKDGKVDSVTITNRNQVSGKLKDGQMIKSTLPSDYPGIIEVLEESGATIEVEESSTPWLAFLFNVAPFILLFGFWIFMMRQMQAGGNKALSFGKSRARLLTSQQKKITFKDVAGVEEAKEELQEIIEFLREPQKFQKLGGRIPKGVLLVGPPGTGKTLLARAIAGEANVPFFSISGSGRHRGAGLGGGHDEREQTLNQLLVEMDGFDSNEGVILIAATNRPDVLDPALLRPGRFDRRVVVNRPDVRGREGILRVHTRKVPLAKDVDLRVLARGTPGFSGADLANLVNEGALFAARQNRKVVTMVDFEMAKDKVLMGAERRSMILTDEEKRTTAYHEAGHALVAASIANADPLHKVTIIPRGQALGVTMQLPLDDKHTYKKVFLKARLAILMGGRIAEEMFLGFMTTGAGNDIEQATAMARQMVCEWGMSAMGPLTFGKKEEQIFLGREISQHRDYSEATAIRIDAEVSNLVKGAYDEAKQIITDNSDVLLRIAEALLEREVLDAGEVQALIEGRELPALSATPTREEEPDEQEVLRPDAPKPMPGLSEGEQPSPA
jgi:cell division protease FtsH